MAISPLWTAKNVSGLDLDCTERKCQAGNNNNLWPSGWQIKLTLDPEQKFCLKYIVYLASCSYGPFPSTANEW